MLAYLLYMASDEGAQEALQQPRPDNSLTGGDLSYIHGAIDLVRVPESLREEIDKWKGETCFKAAAHGLIHSAVQKGRLPLLAGVYLLKELAKDRDLFDAEFGKATGGRRLRLAEQTMDAHQCYDVCFEDLSEERRHELKTGALRSIYQAEQEEAVEEDLFHKLMEDRVGVIEANKRHPNSPFLMARLAAAQGEEGYRQLRVVYPPIPGFPDPEEVAKWLIGEGQEPKPPEENLGN